MKVMGNTVNCSGSIGSVNFYVMPDPIPVESVCISGVIRPWDEPYSRYYTPLEHTCSEKGIPVSVQVFTEK